jgi:hypothetical protein
MVEAEEPPLSPEEIQARIKAARQKRDEANLTKTTKVRRAAEAKQRKTRVNTKLLRNQERGHDETWTIRARADHIKAVKTLAGELSEPGTKVSIAALMDEAIELLLQKYRNRGEGDAE